MKKISQKELIEVIKTVNSSLIHLTTETVVKMNKKGNPLAGEKVNKVTEGEFEFGGTYFDRINESVDSSLGNVIPKRRHWGEWVKGAEGKVIVKNSYDDEGNIVESKFYLRYYNVVGDLDVRVLVNGEDATEEQKKIIDEFSPKKKSEPRKYTTDKGNVVESKVKINVVSFDNIKSLGIGEEMYIL